MMDFPTRTEAYVMRIWHNTFVTQLFQACRKRVLFLGGSYVKYSKIVRHYSRGGKVLVRWHFLNIVRGDPWMPTAHDRQTRESKEPAKCRRRGIYRTISNSTTVNIGFCLRERALGSNVFLVKWSNYPNLSVT